MLTFSNGLLRDMKGYLLFPIFELTNSLSVWTCLFTTPVRDKPHCNSLILFTMLLPVPAEAYF